MASESIETPKEKKRLLISIETPKEKKRLNDLKAELGLDDNALTSELELQEKLSSHCDCLPYST